MKEDLKAAKEGIASEHEVIHLKSMSRTYWERWRWELEKRKEAIVILNSRVGLQSKHLVPPMVNEIDTSMLVDLKGQSELYVGRGSFGIVRLQLYRGIHVAVKELLPKSVKQDVIHEAEVLARLCHPYLPCLFGICTQTQPLRIVMQFHGFLDGPPLAVRDTKAVKRWFM